MPEANDQEEDTQSLCNVCLALIPAEIVFENNRVYLVKECPVHGLQKTLISTDQLYYRQTQKTFLPNNPPMGSRTEPERGCPFDCGLCTEHTQRTCAAIVEITNDCDLKCPICSASSFPGAGNVRRLDEVDRMLDAAVNVEGQLDIAMISGGEPATHPNILEILELATGKTISRVMLITNGIRIATSSKSGARST